MLLDDILNNMKNEKNGSENRMDKQSGVTTPPQMDMFESSIIEENNKVCACMTRNEEAYGKIIKKENLTVIFSKNGFELKADANDDIWEQACVQYLKQWIRMRKLLNS